jgi:hypothetical protein
VHVFHSSMSAVQDTYEIDVIGDVLLVVLKGDPATNDAEPEDDVAGSETLLDDAESVDTLIIQNMLALRMLEPQPDNESSSALPRRHQAHSTRPVRLRVSSHRLLRCSPMPLRSQLPLRLSDNGLEAKTTPSD